MNTHSVFSHLAPFVTMQAAIMILQSMIVPSCRQVGLLFRLVILSHVCRALIQPSEAEAEHVKVMRPTGESMWVLSGRGRRVEWTLINDDLLQQQPDCASCTTWDTRIRKVTARPNTTNDVKLGDPVYISRIEEKFLSSLHRTNSESRTWWMNVILPDYIETGSYQLNITCVTNLTCGDISGVSDLFTIYNHGAKPSTVREKYESQLLEEFTKWRDQNRALQTGHISKACNMERLVSPTADEVWKKCITPQIPCAIINATSHWLAMSRIQPMVFMPEVYELYPSLLDDFVLPEYFTPDNDLMTPVDEYYRMDWRWIIMAPERSGSNHHVDPLNSSAWLALPVGEKKWSFYSPDTQHIPGLKSFNHRKNDYTSIDSYNWWTYTYPHLSNKPLECVQKTGDIFYIPSGWWHNVLNLSPTVAVTQNLVTANTLSEVMNELREQVDSKTDNFLPYTLLSLRLLYEEEYPQYFTPATQVDVHYDDELVPPATAQTTDEYMRNVYREIYQQLAHNS